MTIIGDHNALAKAVCEVLGLDFQYLYGISIDMMAHEVPTITVRTYMKSGKDGRIGDLIRTRAWALMSDDPVSNMGD